jgi:glycosyltransferase involved in cell wall biosynthesis
MKITLCMPVFNEADGICDFLAEIEEVLHNVIERVIIVNDASTDDTSGVIQNFKLSNKTILNIELFENKTNLGHGQTTLVALNRAAATDTEVVVAVDGDGQFKTHEMKRAIECFEQEMPDILEGQRILRSEPIFRRVTTFIVRVIVTGLSNKLTVDGNTPFRIYQANVLKQILKSTPPSSLIPNIYISIISRRQKMRIRIYPMESIQRRGSKSTGSTWQPKKEWLPTKRFILFCLSATIEIGTFLFRKKS